MTDVADPAAGLPRSRAAGVAAACARNPLC